VHRLWPIYIDEKEDNFGQNIYEIKVWCYWEHVGGEHIENLRNMIGNIEGTPKSLIMHPALPHPPNGPWPPLKIIVSSTK